MLPGSSCAVMLVITNAVPKLRPPFVERLAITATPLGVELSASDETIQTLCLRSKATDGSLTRAYGPGGFVKGVIPGMTPLVHDVPLFVDVAQPMSDAPPLKKRPNCAAATIVEPNEYESGSTIVLCWLVEFVNGSVAILTTGIVALAAMLSTSAAAAASPRITAKRGLRGGGKRCIGSSFVVVFRLLAAVLERRGARLRLCLVDDRVVRRQAARCGRLAADEGVEPHVAVRCGDRAIGVARRSVGEREVAARLEAPVVRGRDVVADHPALARVRKPTQRHRAGDVDGRVPRRAPVRRRDEADPQLARRERAVDVRVVVVGDADLDARARRVPV